MAKNHVRDDSSNSSVSDIDEKVSDQEDDEVDHLKKELSNIPFCELQDLRDKVGSKKYNQAIHGVLESREGNSTKMKDKSTNQNKNKPMEVSSKQRVPKLRKVLTINRKAGRDPRFDDISGKFNEDLFRKTYSFVDDIKAKEKKDVERQLKKAKNMERKETLQKLLKQMDHNEKSAKAKNRQQEKKRAQKKAERDLVKQGKKPFYLKKSEQKKIELAEKYKELKSTGKLQKYLNKRRKKTASKDRRQMPERRELTST